MAPTSLAAQFSVLPEAIEALGVHLCVTGGVVDLAMPEISGEGAGIDALVEAGGVPQQMRVNVAHTDAFGRAAEGLEEPIGAQGRAALAQEYVAGVGRLLPPDASQRADLASGERLSAVIRALAAEQLQSVFVGQKIKGSDRAVRLSPLWLGVLRGWRRARRDCRGGLADDRQQAPKNQFAPDFPLEEAGFKPSVPVKEKRRER